MTTLDGQDDVSDRHMKALFEAYKAFYEVSINVNNLLQDSTRSARYQSIPSKEKEEIDNEYIDYEQDAAHSDQDPTQTHSRDGGFVSREKISNPQGGSTKAYEHNANPVWTFEMENKRARKEYDLKKKRSMDMFVRAAMSYLAPEYHFQYKFYSDDVYAQLEDSSTPQGISSWAWAVSEPGPSDIDAYNSYHQLDHGRLLQEEVARKKPELMEALFPLRTSHMLQCMSFPELEYSYGIRYKDIISRFGFGKCDNAIGFIDSDVTSIIIEIGRFFTEIDYSNRPREFNKGNTPNAAGPFVNGPWPDDVMKKYTLNELYGRCHGKGLLQDWKGNKILRIIFDPLRGIGEGTTDRQAGLMYILDTIFAINRTERRGWPLRRAISVTESSEFILDFLETFDAPDEKLEQANHSVFAATALNMNSLTRLGGLNIVWSDCINDHLKFSMTSRTITLFWDVSLLDQSLLFWYNARKLRDFAYRQDSSSAQVQKNSNHSVLYELRSTYRLLLHNPDARQYTTTETCAVKGANQKLGIMVHDLRVDINSPRARKILKHILNAPLPGKLAPYPERKPTSNSHKKRSWIIDYALNYLNRAMHTRTPSTTISTHIAAGPPYSLDLCWHLENILLPFPALVGESEIMRSYADFPRFGPRLRELKYYMDNQKPSGWYQMWKDRRDRVQYVTFWAVLVFGMISIVLALVGIAVSSAQTVAAFKAVDG